MTLSNKQVKWLSITGVIVLVVIIFISIFSSTYNRTVVLGQNIQTDTANISKEDQRRVDLFNNLVDAIQSYNKFEQSTLARITQARAQANKGNVDQAQLTIQAVTEAYPDLKSQANYQNAETEFSVTENRLAGYREQYNNDVRSYNSKIHTFPTNLTLDIMGYHAQNYQYENFNVDNGDARNLFK